MELTTSFIDSSSLYAELLTWLQKSPKLNDKPC